MVELAENRRVQKSTEAALRSQRHAQFKADLDAQLEAKHEELKRIEEQDRALVGFGFVIE